MVVDTEGISIKLVEEDRKTVDNCIVRLTRHLSDQSRNISSSRFVLNAIWVRSFFCQAQLVDWKDLWKVTSLKYIENHHFTLLSFMKPIDLNTLALTSIARDSDLEDVCKLLMASDGPIPLLPQAMRKLQTIYERRRLHTNKESPGAIFGGSKDVTMLKIIGRLTVKQDMKHEIILSVIKDASFDNVGSFQGLESIFTSLSCHHENYDVIKRQMENSVIESLSASWKNRLTVTDVSGLLKSGVGWTLQNLEGWNALTGFLRKQRVQWNNHAVLVNLFADIYDWTEDKKSALEQVIMGIVQTAPQHAKFNLGVAFFQLAIDRHGVFSCTDQSHCSDIAKIVIDQTQLASTICNSPEKMSEITFQCSSATRKSFAQCLSDDLTKSLKHHCSKIDMAVQFCIHASYIKSDIITDIASDILKNSFSIWRPVILQDLLEVDALILKQAYNLLSRFSQEHHAQKLKSIVSRWIIQYNKNAFGTIELNIVSNGITDDKQEAFVEVSGESFPTKIELDKQILEAVIL
jgi:hypothetical protein